MFLTLLTLIAIKLFKCFLHPTKTAIMTTNPSLLLYAQTGSAITTSTHTIILLPFNQDNSATMTTSTHAQNLLLPSVQDDPAITMTNHANSKLQLIVESLFLFHNEDNSKTMAPSLLLFCIKDAPAIMTAPLANFSLQLIIEYLLLPRNFESPAITMVTHAKYSQLIVESLFLLRNKDNSELWLQVSCSFASKTHQQL